MTKQIKGVIPMWQQWWGLTPNIKVYSFINSRKTFIENKKVITFLEIFYFFAKNLIKVSKQNLTKEQEIKITRLKERILIELNNRVEQLIFFAKKTKQQAEKFLEKRLVKRISSYKHGQIFLWYLTASLDALHSIRDQVKAVDELIGKNYSNSIWNKKWFKLDVDLRTLLHHIESPIFTYQRKKFIFYFERTNLLKYPQFFKDKNLNRVECHLKNLTNTGQGVIKALNLWAKKYLKLLDPKTEMVMHTRFKRNGKFISKTKEIILDDLLKIAHTIT